MSRLVSRTASAAARAHQRVRVAVLILLALCAVCGLGAGIRAVSAAPAVERIYAVDGSAARYAGRISGRCGSAFSFTYAVAHGDQFGVRGVRIGRSMDGSRIMLSFPANGCRYRILGPYSLMPGSSGRDRGGRR